MLYIALTLVLLLLGLLTLLEWRKTKRFSSQALQRLHRQVSEHLSLSQWQAASRILNQLRDKAPGDPHTEVLHIQLLRRTKRAKEAMKAADALLAKQDLLLAHRERGKLLIEKGDARGALQAFDRCLPLLRDEEDLLALASTYYRVGNMTKAWETLQPLLESSQNGQLLALGGDCCFSISDYEGALHLYEKALELEVNNHQVLARMGHCLRRLRRFKEAEKCFTTILQRDSNNISDTLSLGACLEAQKQHAKALMVYQHGKAWELGDARLLRQAGICAVHTGRYSYAEIYLKRAIAGGARSAQAIAFLAFALERQQKWAQAEQIYLMLTREYPNHIAGCRGLAWLFGVGLTRATQAEVGLAMAYQSVKLMPDELSWETLSACQARSGNFDQAHEIQERLSRQEQDRTTQRRRQAAMRALRKKMPLDERLVPRALVA